MKKLLAFGLRSRLFRMLLILSSLSSLSLFPFNSSAAPLLSISTRPPAAANLNVLYRGTGLPATEGFAYLTDPLFSASAKQKFADGVTNLDTTPVETDKAGYFKSPVTPLPAVLDRSTGFSLRFTVQILSENHANNDRAGFSVILLDNDKKGIELAFWPDQIWVQNDGAEVPPAGGIFTHGEGGAFNTTTGLTTYDLTILGNNYYVASNGKAILNGPVRDYSVFGAPYNISNFLFLGDDTTSASANINLSYVSITTFSDTANSFDVRLTTDSGDSSVKNSLSWALTQVQADSNQSITFSVDSVTLQPNSAPLPPLKSGVTIQQSCASPVTIDGGGLNMDGLTLQGNNKITGLKITHFGGKQIAASANSRNNLLKCVTARR